MPRVRRCLHMGCHSYAYIPNHYCDEHKDDEATYQARRSKYKHDKQTTWHYNHVTRYRNPIKAKQNKFYHSKEWKLLREQVFQRDYHLCQYCKINSGNIVDHVLPIEAFSEGMRELDNLVTCCRDCHYKKTRWEEHYYGTGQYHKQTGANPITNIENISELMNALYRQYKSI